MRLTLKESQNMVMEEQPVQPDVNSSAVTLTVSYCAICRTDAKMWREGHRDLALPRVLGHEFVGRDIATGQLFVSWPGMVCNSCRYCLTDRENLCESMRIIGFHADGGFSRQVCVPRDSLIMADETVDEMLLTFAEPIACVLNCMEQLKPQKDERLIIYGGGVVGMLAALAAKHVGCMVTVIERSAEKIARLSSFCDLNQIEIVKDTTAADFDLAINCCDSHIAFSQAITKLRKAGKLGFFSGLKKREDIESGLLNLIHYKELEMYGSYGPRRAHMAQAVKRIADWRDTLPLLVEKVIDPTEAEIAFAHILSGNALKYIIDFRGYMNEQSFLAPEIKFNSDAHQTAPSLSYYIEELIAEVNPVDRRIEPAARYKIDLKTKPLGALGRVEELAVQLSVIQQSLMPQVDSKHLFVFAGDHGVVDEGVSAFPAKVTVQMVENFLAGGAAINVFCRQYGIGLNVVDMGVNTTFTSHPLLIDKKVAPGTANFTVQPAMTQEQALAAIENGARAFLEKQAVSPCQIVGMGEMGIGNTSSAAAIICAVSGLSSSQVVGRGTGVDDEGLKRKREVIDRALRLHRPSPDNGLELLTKLGGYELAGIAGAVIAAASKGCCVVLDGIISTAAGLIAYLICPAVQGYLVAGHRSVEQGQQAALKHMGLTAIIDLDFRLGEGTGAAITMNLVDLACRTMREMASFEEAGVDSGNI
ncbi:nicotinate-nucleotide--dimethylbenzimidazole phosphoribosyltransferase [Desulfopila aestuarii]|uniref:Nicotinate-nucleotide--dimethylbenzimidazole phosphoribosyltransferase n=1 Tax=Desulfopila aestuarii DSM 18488 TaxID=1121416 RepID=A0A1M7Y3X9_9BACT|nr:nicotinate-nucleotide--dimethylbenzimidazole phosphoribosyltransferase [Desulfopila aestuarii]SHO46709.1 nicotinate-nucleotide-dimethylbenzimidazole phosphoribosyltransferase [Desulfopila aestuarii DSM 18488]